MDIYKEAISEAKKAVENEDEPFKSVAFKVILERLLNLQDTGHEIERPRTILGRAKRQTSQIEPSDASEKGEITFDIPKEYLTLITKLDDRDKIPLLWHYSSRKSMTISEFLVAASQKGFNLAKSYLPSRGGNFTNRLVKADGVLAKDGKKGTSIKFKLTDVGILKVQETINGFSDSAKQSK
ncbi:MAG: hypothetical protein JRN20_23215 [Nitrososphaerota archaeon]|nr:hypothetical protein [Nitrososphaerota archaeon]